MERSSAISQLAALAGTLRPAGQTTLADLQTAQAALAASLLHNAAEPPPGAAGAAAASALAAAETHVAAAAASARLAPMALLRGLPMQSALGINPAVITPAASPTAGMAAKTLGPFIDHLGQPQWVDIFPPLAQAMITRAGAAGPVLTLPLTLPLALSGGAQPTSYAVGAGTLWVASAALAAGAPAGGFTGLLISGGTIGFSAPPILAAGNLQIAVGDVVTLTVSLAAAASPVGGGGLGADGGAVVAEFPPQVSFSFAASGGTLTAAGAAALTVYGQQTPLQWQSAAPVFDAPLQQILVPMTAPPGSFTPTAVHSTLVQPGGTAPIVGAAWALPVAVTAAAQLGSAAGTGSLLLALGAGLSLTWRGLAGGPASLPRAYLFGAPGALELLAPLGRTLRLGTTFTLWPEPGAAHRRSSIDAAFPPGALVAFFSIATPGAAAETLGCGGIIAAHLDRPLAADGARLGPTLPGAVWVSQSDAAAIVLIAAAAPQGLKPPPIAMALANALMVTSPPRALLVVGAFTASPTELATGGMQLGFDLVKLLPTLPDPYAANFLPSGRTIDRPVQNLIATVLWMPATDTVLGFTTAAVQPGQLQGALPRANAAATQQDGLVAAPGWQDQEHVAALGTLFHDSIGATPATLFLLDVSSNVDQFGVGIVPIRQSRVLGARAEVLGVAGMDLVAPVADLRAFTVPQVQWEPVINVPNPDAPFPSPVAFRDDGGPTLLGSNDVTLVPVTPARVLDQVVAAYQSGAAAAAALFTLSFGMKAAVTLAKRGPPHHSWVTLPALTPVEPAFPTVNLAGGRQISLTAGRGLQLANAPSPSLPGATVQLRNLVGRDGNAPDPPPPPPVSVLGPAVDGIFNGELAPGGTSPFVPLERIDFSGYGESTFSAWVDPNAAPPAVTQVKFNVLTGRASHEVVQVKSILYPWGAILVRTITIERQDNAELNRHDSGWVAATPGVFATGVFARGALGGSVAVHPGAVHGAYNIREIRDTTQTYANAAKTILLQAVYFDADLKIDGILTGGRNGLVPSRGQLGYVQTLPIGEPISADDLAALIAARGPLGGPVDCVIGVGGSQQPMRLHRAEVATAPSGGQAQFAAVARGSLVLPAQGSWSVVLRTDAISEPQPVDADRGVPLIRGGLAGEAATAPWCFAEASDLADPAAAATDYCLLHATSATRVLFPRPKIETGAAAITSTVVPLLADGFALMEATGIMPRQDSALRFPNAGYTLDITGPGALTLGFSPNPFVPTLPGRTLAASASSTIGLEYADEHGTPTQISVAITPAAWSVRLPAIGVRLDMDPFPGLMRTVGDLTADSAAGSGFGNPRLVLAPALQPLQMLMTFLEGFGMPDPFQVAFSNGGWKHTTKYKMKAGLTFNLPINTVGFTFAINFKLGFGNVASSEAALFTTSSQWLAYFSFKGTVQVPVFPLVKVGGLVVFKLETTFANGTTPETDKLTLQLGVILTVGGSIIPGVLDLQASVAFAFLLVVVTSTPSSIGVGVALIMSASGTVLSGLIGITFTAEADGLVIFQQHPSQTSVQATFDIQIDVSICWFINFNLDVQQQYTKALG